jgi:hypothetical protein
VVDCTLAKFDTGNKMPNDVDRQWDKWIASQLARAVDVKEEYDGMFKAPDAPVVFEPREQQLKDFALLQAALRGTKGVDQQAIAMTGLEWVTTLLRKNADYGGSAWQTPALAPDMQTADAILVRMSDKIARLAQLRTRSAEVTSESFMDTMGDLGAYALLYVAYIRKQQLCEDACKCCGELGGVEKKD